MQEARTVTSTARFELSRPVHLSKLCIEMKKADKTYTKSLQHG